MTLWFHIYIFFFASQPAAISVQVSIHVSLLIRGETHRHFQHYQIPTNFAQLTQQSWSNPPLTQQLIHQKCGRQGFLFLSGRRDSYTRHPMEKGKNIYIIFHKACFKYLLDFLLKPIEWQKYFQIQFAWTRSLFVCLCREVKDIQGVS